MKILFALMLLLPVLTFGQNANSKVGGSVRNLIQNNQSLTWKTFQSSGQVISEGELAISNLVSNSFEVRQKNNNNPSAGAVLLYGGILNKDSQIVILNLEYHEVWVGSVVGDKIVGRIEGTDIKFEIRR